jgi:hypothetical protein
MMVAQGASHHWRNAALLLALWAGTIWAEMLTFDSAAQWQTWQMPYGLVQIGQDGALGPVKFRKEINAVADAHLFTHATQKRGVVSGGIWAAGTRPGEAVKIIDGDPQTWWKPDPLAPREDWVVDIDLGRAVLARQIRLKFPDREGARPFRQFTVYVSTGARIQATEDVFEFIPVYRTTQPNQATSIAIPLSYLGTDSTLVLDEGMDVDLAYESGYQVIQYISIVVEQQSQDAALAEVEVLAVGDNISLGTLQRGSFVNGLVAVFPQNLFDADMNTFGMVTSGYEGEGSNQAGWKAAGVWWGVDLGAVFFIDELFFYYQNRGEGVSGFIWFTSSSGPGHRILYSAGERAISSGLPVPEARDYTELLTHINPKGDGLFQIRYLFKPRPMRYLFWHGTTHLDWGEARTMELMIFSSGYPAQVTLRSDFIDLGQLNGDRRPKVIKALHWDADLPSGTRLQLRSRSGNTMAPLYTFYDKKGEAVTEAKWNSLPKVVRGPIDTSMVIGEDWGEWSNVYQFSGESFKSESPRSIVQLEMILSTDHPRVAPLVRSLSIEYEDALLQEARGSVHPRQARPNQDTRFTYTLWPSADAGDRGFDLLRFTIPNLAGIKDVAVRLGDQEIAPAQVAAMADSLFITLPQKIKGDSLQIDFTTRVLQNATVFSLDLGDGERPGLWQSVAPATRRSNVVLLPELAGSQRLISDLEVSSSVFTPNGDGVNDLLTIRFVAFKVQEAEPQLRIYDLAGRLIAHLAPVAVSGAHHTFSWMGRDLHNALVAPGIYVCHIGLGAQAGQDTDLLTIGVAH